MATDDKVHAAISIDIAGGDAMEPAGQRGSPGFRDVGKALTRIVAINAYTIVMDNNRLIKIVTIQVSKGAAAPKRFLDIFGLFLENVIR